MKLMESPLVDSLKKILGDRYHSASDAWTISPYDWGPIRTSKKEEVRPGRHCTCMILVKYGQSKYEYVAIYWWGSKKKPKVFKRKGFPKFAVEETSKGRNYLHRINRNRLV